MKNQIRQLQIWNNTKNADEDARELYLEDTIWILQGSMSTLTWNLEKGTEIEQLTHWNWYKPAAQAPPHCTSAFILQTCLAQAATGIFSNVQHHRDLVTGYLNVQSGLSVIM